MPLVSHPPTSCALANTSPSPRILSRYFLLPVSCFLSPSPCFCYPSPIDTAPKIDATLLVSLHDQATIFWHDPTAPAPAPADPFHALVLEQHRANFDLWHREDAARDPMSGDQAIAACKRAIDKLNQRRNDLAERIDLALLESIPAQSPTLPLNSETPGLIIDRLSILALKIFHTDEEAHRPTATVEHHDRNHDRLLILHDQRHDLALCLDELWQAVLTGHRRFKLYRQLKMYNDPSLNPVLYNSHSG